MLRVCKKCSVEKDIELFIKCKDCLYKRGWVCRQCINKNSKKWRLNNKTRKDEVSKKWRNNNVEKIAQLNRKWHLNNPEKAKASYRKWRKNHPEKYTEGRKRRHARRERNLEFIPINVRENNFVGHHIDKSLVVYIPEELHKSVIHKQTDSESMKEINILAIQICYV